MENRVDYEYVDEMSIPEDICCPLCTGPFEEPVCANQCGHTFCCQCITKAFDNLSQCPTCREPLELTDFHPVKIRPFLNQLNQLLVKCKICSTTNIQRGNFKDHTTKCMVAYVSCPAADIKCGWTGKRGQLQEHIEICPLIRLQPMFSELNELVKRQSEQICFLFTVLRKSSENQKNACQEKLYNKGPGSIYCDVCEKVFTFNDRIYGLHYCPNTDICVDCVEKHFPRNKKLF